MDNENSLSKKRTLGLLNSALTSWCGSKLVKFKESRKQVKKNGKKMDNYDYMLQNRFQEDLIKCSALPINSLQDIFYFKSLIYLKFNFRVKNSEFRKCVPKVLKVIQTKHS